MSTSTTESGSESDYQSSELGLSSDQESDSDLEDLYASFDYEDDASQVSASSIDAATRTTENETFGREIPGCNKTPLYPGAQLSSFESKLLLFQYAIRHGLTTRAFTELLLLISVHLPPGAAVPKSVYSLKRCFLESFPEAEASQNYYCSCCQRFIPSAVESCSGNGCSGGYPAAFITVPIGPQIKRMMEGV